MTAPVWLLLTAGAARGVAKPLAVRVGVGVHGQAVRRVDVAGCDPELRHAATGAVTEAARILYRERHLDREIVVNFALPTGEGFGNVIGRSAELAFALALAGAAVARALPAIAATGLVEEGGAIRPVEGIAEKLAAALDVLPAGGVFAFPAANEQTLSDRLRADALARGVTLMPAHRLEDLLARLGVPITRTWLSEPFRGLEPFGFSHASIFFGRDTEIAAIVALLSRRSAALVRGPSGTGKSSLVLAGVLPALLRSAGDAQVRWGLLRPRDIVAPEAADPRDAVAHAVGMAWAHDEQGGLGAGLGADALSPDADALVARLHAHGARRPVLVIDQLEELFEPRLPATTVGALVAFLAEINRRGVVLIATITNAAMPELSAQAPLAACFGIEGQYVLEPRHDPTLLEAVIAAPAAAAGLRFETGLQAELVAAASHGGSDVLPLLELLLTELYDRRDPAAPELRLADYRAVGGLDGVVSARAEGVFAQLAADQQAAVPLMLWKLATAGAIETDDLAQEHPIHGVLAAYQARRLLVRDRAGGPGAILRAAHEALLRHWSRAVAQRTADGSDIERWLDLTREARQRGRGERALIPPGPQLEAAGSLLQRRRPFLTRGDAAVVDYVKQSLHQRQRRTVLAALAAGVPLAAGLGWGGMVAVRRWRAQFEQHITFDDVEISGKDKEIPAEDYLLPLGIRVSARTPADSSIVIIRSLDYYTGRAASGVAGQHFLTQQVADQTVPNDFTLTFERPPKRIGLLRAKLWAATGSGVTHPAWRAEARGANGEPLGAVSEDLLRALPDSAHEHRLLLLDRQARVIGAVDDFVPAQLYVVSPQDAGQNIPSLRITSDYRLDGQPFAGSRSVLINEMILYYA